MQTETKLDYLNKKYTHKINDLKTDEERKKAAQIMLDKSREILTEEESIYHQNRLFIESRLTWQHKGKEIDQYKVREYNTHNVRSEAKILYFRIPGAKGNYVEAYDRANSAVMGAKGKVQNLYEPQTVNISYDEYCDEPVYKKSLTAKRYKDGLLLVIRGHAFVKKKGDNLMMMLLREDYEENNITGTYKILKINQETLRANSDIDWNDKCFDNQLVLYIIDPDVHKTKGVKIIIRKNSVNRNIHKLRRLDFKSLYNKPWELIGYNDKSSVKGKTSFLINDFWKIVEEANWFLETLVEQQNDPKLFKILMNLNKISKKELLSIGWKASLIELFNSVQILADMLNNNLQEKNNNNFFNGITHFDRLSEKEYMKAALEAFYNFKDYNKFMLSDSLNIPPNSEKFVESFNTCFDYCRYLLLKARVLLFDTDQGTSVNKMSINTEEMSETDCLLFWRELELCDYVSASMHQYKRCPLMFRDDKVINNMDILDPLFIDSF